MLDESNMHDTHLNTWTKFLLRTWMFTPFYKPYVYVSYRALYFTRSI